jgi:hypothetical protein
MSSYKVVKLDKKRNHLEVEFDIDGEGKRKVRFDNNYLPQDEAGLKGYMEKWIEAYVRGKAAVTPHNAE